MALASSTSSRMFKGAMTCLWLVALVIVASQLTMQFTAAGGNARSQSLASQTRRNNAVVKTTSKVMTDAASTSSGYTAQAADDSSITLTMFIIGSILALSCVVGPMSALTIGFSFALVACAGLALGGLLLALAAGGTVAVGGAEVVRSRVQQMDRARWASWYFGRADFASRQ